MSINLNEALLKEPREKDGARTLSRYGFQVHSSLSKILDLYKSKKPFRALFDHFDDLVILEGEENITVRSYQIKGKGSGNWTASSISKCKTAGDGKTSYIGKMYQLTEIFGQQLTECHFLTNAPFSFQKKDKTKTTSDDEIIKIPELHQDEKDKFSTTLSLSYPLPRSPSEEQIIVFELTDVPIKKYDVTLKGELVEFLERDTASHVTGIYNALVAEAFRKSRNTQKPSSVADLLKYKAMSDKDIEVVISEADSRMSVLDCWDEIRLEFAPHLSGTDLIRLKTSVIDYTWRNSRGDTMITKLAEKCSLATSLVNDPDENIYDMTIQIFDKIFGDLEDSYEKQIVLAACLVQSFESFT